jgi:2,3-bisphosphoglycerate-dependent phosphoglycerate mutase
VLALLVRHGQTDANLVRAFLGRRVPPLNEVGRAEAAALGRGLAGRRVAAVYASDLTRAWETAQAVAAATGAPLAAEPGLREMDIGLLDGLGVDEGTARFPEVFERWRRRAGSCRMPEGETLREVRDRAWAVLARHAAHHERETAAFVTHTFVVLAIVCKVLGLPLDRFRGLHVGTGSVTVVRLDGGHPRLVALNVRPEGGWG